MFVLVLYRLLAEVNEIFNLLVGLKVRVAYFYLTISHRQLQSISQVLDHTLKEIPLIFRWQLVSLLEPPDVPPQDMFSGTSRVAVLGTKNKQAYNVRKDRITMPL